MKQPHTDDDAKATTSFCFAAVDREVNLVHAGFSWLPRELFGFSSTAVAHRLAQAVLFDLLPCYAACIRKFSGDLAQYPTRGSVVGNRQISVITGTGRVRVSAVAWFRNQLRFFFHWSAVLAAILTHKSKNDSAPIGSVILLAAGEDAYFRGDDDTAFATFCREGPIFPLREAECIYAEVSRSGLRSLGSNIRYSKRPLLLLARSASLRWRRRISILLRHARIFLAYYIHSIRHPILSVLCRDLPYVELVRGLSRAGVLRAVVTTCSSFNVQPLWMRECVDAPSHMIWYAQNWRPITYLSDRYPALHPNLRWIWVDMHWVWTRAFAEYLKQLVHHGDIEAVGPLIWTLPNEVGRERNAAHGLSIALFDVPAFSDAVALRNGELTNYFRAENLRAFVDGVLRVAAILSAECGRRVTIRLKMKRGYSADYDRGYYEYINELSKRRQIVLESYSESLYSLIAASDLVIAYPFTSPAYVAESLKVPFVYFDPTKSIQPHDFCDMSPEQVRFVAGEEQLLKVTRRILASGRMQRVDDARVVI